MFVVHSPYGSMRVALLALALFLAPAASAQGPAPADRASTVTFSLQALVPVTDAPVSEIVAALSDDAHLVQLDLSRSSAIREEVQAEFAFRDMADYTAWRGSDRVVALLDQIEAESQGAGVTTALSLRRSPLAGGLPDGG